MSEVSEGAYVALLLADFANVDQTGRLNVLGAGWQATAINPQTRSTAPQAVAVVVEVPSEFVGQTYTLELFLVDDNLAVVQMPGPMGPATPLRLGQLIQVEPPTGFPGAGGGVRPRTQMVMNFPGGLQLEPNRSYEWVARIDSDDTHEARAMFRVVGGPTPPVLG